MFVALPRKVDTMLPRLDAGHEHGKQTNEFAARGSRAKSIHTFYEIKEVVLGTSGCTD
jgi:hypothetical protein